MLFIDEILSKCMVIYLMHHTQYKNIDLVWTCFVCAKNYIRVYNPTVHYRLLFGNTGDPCHSLIRHPSIFTSTILHKLKLLKAVNEFDSEVIYVWHSGDTIHCFPHPSDMLISSVGARLKNKSVMHACFNNLLCWCSGKIATWNAFLKASLWQGQLFETQVRHLNVIALVIRQSIPLVFGTVWLFESFKMLRCIQ